MQITKLKKSMILVQKSNVLGALSSGLCLIHCVFTPFLFVAKSHSMACCSSTPSWWGIIDYLFLIISFYAIHISAKTTSKTWMKYALWFCWVLLFFIILNEHLSLIYLVEESIYIPSLSLVFLHIYNHKYCQCTNEKCCANN